MSGIVINESLEIPDEQLEWSFARSSGPGGQNVNKVNSKATLRWRRQLGTLSGAAWMRFKQNAKRYLTSNDEVLIQSQEHRDQSQNIEACREKLRSLVLASLKPPKRRVPTKPTAGSRARRLDNKRKLSEKKRGRQGSDH
jgi:ribosome-associated protein